MVTKERFVLEAANFRSSRILCNFLLLSLLMQIKTLENTSLADVTVAFNEAFRGYFIKLEFTEEGMARKIKSEGIQLQYSVGAFEGGQLVGFILHAFDMIDGVKTIYNAGTGVIAPFRGQRLTEALYQYAISLLTREGIYHHLLEVIENNYPAIRVYEKMGFVKVRTLYSFKNSSVIPSPKTFSIKEVTEVPAEAHAFSDMASAWQNSLASVQRDIDGHQLIGAFDGDELIGFAAYVSASGRVKQLAVHPVHRCKGLGRAMMQYMFQNSTSGQLVVTNIDKAYEPANKFLQALGFENFLTLYEMKLQVKEGS